jgi:hypothetical protein
VYQVSDDRTFSVRVCGGGSKLIPHGSKLFLKCLYLLVKGELYFVLLCTTSHPSFVVVAAGTAAFARLLARALVAAVAILAARAAPVIVLVSHPHLQLSSASSSSSQAAAGAAVLHAGTIFMLERDSFSSSSPSVSLRMHSDYADPVSSRSHAAAAVLSISAAIPVISRRSDLFAKCCSAIFILEPSGFVYLTQCDGGGAHVFVTLMQ